jgi:hypothetical protein
MWHAWETNFEGPLVEPFAAVKRALVRVVQSIDTSYLTSVHPPFISLCNADMHTKHFHSMILHSVSGRDELRDRRWRSSMAQLQASIFDHVEAIAPS